MSWAGMVLGNQSVLIVILIISLLFLLFGSAEIPNSIEPFGQPPKAMIGRETSQAL
jgi:hypothetical protein